MGCRRGKALAVFHDNLNILGAITQLAAAKGKGNGFQPVRAKRVRVQDFKDGAETEADGMIPGRVVRPVAGRFVVPTDRTARRHNARSILPPRIHLTPVFDISFVLVQYSVPFIALGRTAPGLTRTCTTTSHGRRTQRIVHAAGCVVFAENQLCGIQGIPAYILRYGIIRHKQAVEIFVVLCILLGGCHR